MLQDSLRLFTRKSESDPFREKNLPLPERPLVIDAGGVVENELRFADEFSRLLAHFELLSVNDEPL